MSDIISKITAKSKWMEKIKDEAITNRWRIELQKHCLNDQIIDTTFRLLQKSRSQYLSHTKFQEESDYDWHLLVGASPQDIWPTEMCSCECLICVGEESLPDQLQEYYENDENYRNIQNNLKKYKKIKCICQDYRSTQALSFLKRNLYFQINMIPNTLKQRFIQNICEFEKRKGRIDFHPGSNEQVIDIIHPSLFCYVKGVSPVQHCERNDLVEKSDLLQWLPAEFSVQRNELNHPIRTEIRSYINNLPYEPSNHPLYKDIGEIFTLMTPGFERILNDLRVSHRIKALTEDHLTDSTNTAIQLNNCQVIVKIAKTVVNEENPNFNEGSWHLEGINAEKIIATGIYYYNIENIQPHYLRFRTTLNSNIDDLLYPQSCPEYVKYHYGFTRSNDDQQSGGNALNANISLGRIPTRENLCLFFPNFLQHRISKLSLDDTWKNGSRSILVFFLINPFEKVLSTAFVPPQQAELGGNRRNFPCGQMKLEDAKMYQELLMFERKYEYSTQNAFHQRVFSLCEH